MSGEDIRLRTNSEPPCDGEPVSFQYLESDVGAAFGETQLNQPCAEVRFRQIDTFGSGDTGR